jgi:hypothetical protein
MRDAVPRGEVFSSVIHRGHYELPRPCAPPFTACVGRLLLLTSPNHYGLVTIPGLSADAHARAPPRRPVPPPFLCLRREKPSCSNPRSLRASVPLRTSFHLVAEDSPPVLETKTITDMLLPPRDHRSTTFERFQAAPYHLFSGANRPLLETLDRNRPDLPPTRYPRPLQISHPSYTASVTSFRAREVLLIPSEKIASTHTPKLMHFPSTTGGFPCNHLH